MQKLVSLFAIAVLGLACAPMRAAELTADSSADQVLDALDARGQGLESFTADVKLSESDAATGDSSTRSYFTVVQAAGP